MNPGLMGVASFNTMAAEFGGHFSWKIIDGRISAQMKFGQMEMRQKIILPPPEIFLAITSPPPAPPATV